MKILVSAAEASSDNHGAALVREIRRECAARGERLEVAGIGGSALLREGLTALVDTRELLSMGLVEVFGKIPKILAALDRLEAWAKKEKPDFAILIDYPEFHFKLAERLNRLGVPCVSYIPPKVWVWRKGRLKKLARLYRHVFTILPFEEEIYRQASVSADYIGNPLLDELPLTMTKDQARAELSISPSEKVLLLMPGSRPAEIDYHLAPMLRAATILQKEGVPGGSRRLKILMPLAETVDLEDVKKRIAEARVEGELDLRLTQGDAWRAMVAADAGIIKSGTSSLEAALLGCPHVVVYRMHAFSEWAFRTVVRYKKPISLVNLILDQNQNPEKIVQELIFEKFSPERMAVETLPLLSADSFETVRMRREFGRVRGALSPGGGADGPSRFAARRLLELAPSFKHQEFKRQEPKQP